MDYVERIKKINALAKSLKDNGLAADMDEAVKKAEGIIGGSAEPEEIKEEPQQEQLSSEPDEEQLQGPVHEVGEEQMDPPPKPEEAKTKIEVKEEGMPAVEATETKETPKETDEQRQETAEPASKTTEIPKGPDEHPAETKTEEDVLKSADEKEEGFFDKIKEKFTKKEDQLKPEEVEKELEKPEGTKGFFEKIIDKFKKKDDEAGFEEVKAEHKENPSEGESQPAPPQKLPEEKNEDKKPGQEDKSQNTEELQQDKPLKELYEEDKKEQDKEEKQQ